MTRAYLQGHREVIANNIECEGAAYVPTRRFKDSILDARQLYEPKLKSHMTD